VNIAPACAALPAAVAAQYAALRGRWAIPAASMDTCFAVLTDEALRGPFGAGPHRFSAMNGDGVPFQWSVSVGPRPGGVRFLVDCGVPGTSISARLAHTRDLLARLAGDGMLRIDQAGLDRALRYLLPQPDLLDTSLMGVWLAGALLRDGTSHFKVYVNALAGEVAPRYYRFGTCLAAHGRMLAVERLAALVAVVGERAVPVATAFDLTDRGVGRFKMYFRPRGGDPTLLVAAAEALGQTGAMPMLELLRRTLTLDGDYPVGAVVFSAEFPEFERAGDFKVDVNTALTLTTDAEADRRIRTLIAAVGLADDEYRDMRDVVVGARAAPERRQLLFVGLALRAKETRVNVYMHPGSVEEP
jgi:hypothetical protein